MTDLSSNKILKHENLKLQAKLRQLKNELFLVKENESKSIAKYMNLYANMEEKVVERTQLIRRQNKILQDEIKERKKIEEKLKSANELQDYYLQEIHHRVKNNMQVISSLLNLQLKKSNDRRIKSILKDSQHRIRSMALVHEHIFRHTSSKQVNFAMYVKTLITSVFHSYKSEQIDIRLIFELKNVYSDLEISTPLGLIINEIITNAMKYAFPQPGDDWQIKISLQELENNQIELIISDNGVGIPDDFDINNNTSMGLHLISMLVEKQLKGKLEIIKDKGTTFKILINQDQKNFK